MRGSNSTSQLLLDNWPRRRRWMKIILTWAIVNAQYIIVWGKDSGLHENALIALLSLIFAIMGSYVFGATWDDRDKRRHAGFGRQDEQPEGEGE